jgi:thiol-disulfide isomerase/thioredoxin
MKHLLKYIFLLLFLFSFGFLKAQNIGRQDTTNIILVETVGSLDDLFQKFHGKVVYVDFWASWCGSCLEEFKTDPELEKFIKSNNIVRLYIALEKQEQDPAMQLKSVEKWKSLAKKYNLAGYHYYALLRSEFMKGITAKIMKGKLSLPRFAIIDAGGTIVDRDAKRPANVNGLIKELSKYLRNN